MTKSEAVNRMKNVVLGEKKVCNYEKIKEIGYHINGK